MIGVYLFLFNDLLYFRKILLYIGVCDFVVCQVACQILVVSGHVDQAVTGQVEQDRTWFAFDFSLLCLRIAAAIAWEDSGAGIMPSL